MPRHDPTPMSYVTRTARRYHCSIRGKPTMRQAWYHVYQCVACGSMRSFPCNFYKGRKLEPVCKGGDNDVRP